MNMFLGYGLSSRVFEFCGLFFVNWIDMLLMV